MKIKPAGPKLPVVNYDAPAQEGVLRKHGSLFGGESRRALIVGASGSGKTNIMISLITHPSLFKRLYIVNLHTNLNTNICAKCWNH
nr:unnamed protein product [Callosobruchus analis]